MEQKYLRGKNTENIEKFCSNLKAFYKLPNGKKISAGTILFYLSLIYTLKQIADIFKNLNVFKVCRDK